MSFFLLLLLPTVTLAECCPYPVIPWSIKDVVPSFVDYNCEVDQWLDLKCPGRYDYKAAILGDYNKTGVINIIVQSATDKEVIYWPRCEWRYGWCGPDLVQTVTGPFYTDFTCAYNYRNENKWRVVGYDGFQ